MNRIPLPDSPDGPMGRRWLHHLRLQGAGTGELGRVARELADAVSDDQESRVLRDFQQFVMNNHHEVL